MKRAKTKENTGKTTRRGTAAPSPSSKTPNTKQDKKGSEHETKTKRLPSNGQAPKKAKPKPVRKVQEPKDKVSETELREIEKSEEFRSGKLAATKPTYLITFLGIMYDKKTNEPKGKQFQVRVQAETKEIAVFYGMGAAERISRFFDQRMELVVLVATQCVAPIILERKVVPIPECWMNAFESAKISSYVFDQNGEKINER